jgi:hypothetical protein
MPVFRQTQAKGRLSPANGPGAGVVPGKPLPADFASPRHHKPAERVCRRCPSEVGLVFRAARVGMGEQQLGVWRSESKGVQDLDPSEAFAPGEAHASADGWIIGAGIRGRRVEHHENHGRQGVGPDAPKPIAVRTTAANGGSGLDCLVHDSTDLPVAIASAGTKPPDAPITVDALADAILG